MTLDLVSRTTTSTGPLISVIVCSVNPKRRQQLGLNLERTIGVDYEYIFIANEVEGLGICAAYNRAAETAVGEFLCFVHEDVEFLTPDWGQKLIAHFKADEQIAALGVAGSRFKSAAISGWFTNNPLNDCANIHHGATSNQAEHGWMKPRAFTEVSRVPVRVLDGVWICARREVWVVNRFNERVSGFHFYDIDFSLRCSEQWTVAVVYDIDLLHFSLGNFGDSWAEAALLYHAEYSNRLPVHCEPYDQKLFAIWELQSARFWVKFLRGKVRRWSLKRRWLDQMPAIVTWKDLWHRIRFFLS